MKKVFGIAVPYQKLSGLSSISASAWSIRSTARRPQPAVTHIATAATQIIKTSLLLFIPYKNTQNCPDCQIWLFLFFSKILEYSNKSVFLHRIVTRVTVTDVTKKNGS